jgi:hypothetical protein
MVEAMLDLVKDENVRIDSRFLEPACGNGNFLVRILRCNLAAVELKYGKSDFERRHFALGGRNPDVLTCIANLSNDEEFTPPEFANRMLDTLAEAWATGHNGADNWIDEVPKFHGLDS